MPRPSASVPPEAIRIEDEVWQEAFSRREPAQPKRLQVIDGGRAPAAPNAALHTVERPTAPRPRTTAGQQPAGGIPGRRTVTIRGYGAERNLPWPDGSRPRPQRRIHERAGFQPDRVAMWAVLLGVLLVIVAIASAH